MHRAVASRLDTGLVLTLSLWLPMTVLFGHRPSHEEKFSGLANGWFVEPSACHGWPRNPAR